MTKSLPTVSNLILEGNLDTCIHNIFQGWVCNCHMMVWYTGHWYIAWSVLLRTCIGSIVHRTREWTNAHFALRFQNSLDMTINCLQLKLLMKQSYLICGADDSWVRKCQLTYHDTLISVERGSLAKWELLLRSPPVVNKWSSEAFGIKCKSIDSYINIIC